MTRQEIIEMAIQAGFVDYELDDGTTHAFDERYEAFAVLVASAEREACAKKVENALLIGYVAPQRKWVGLTAKEKHEFRYSHMTTADFIEDIEAKLKEKNTRGQE